MKAPDFSGVCTKCKKKASYLYNISPKGKVIGKHCAKCVKSGEGPKVIKKVSLNKGKKPTKSLRRKA